nr:response regulator transcription factor [uncultured Rhodopila sp.]
MATARPVLVVVGDETVSQALTEHIAVAGAYRAATASNLGDATRRLDAADARFDLVILSADLPDGDGPDFCARLRDHGHRMPIVMFAEAANDNDVTRALNSGATDFIVMPFRAAELLARLRAALRSYDDSVNAVFTIGPWTFFPSDRLLTRRDGGRRIRLGNKEVSLLKYFCRAGDRVVSPRTLLAEVWGYHAAVRTHTLETHVYRLRRRLEFDPKAPLFLVTEPGGYRLNDALVARQGEFCRSCDAEKKQAADWCVPSPDVRCHAFAGA